MTPTVWHYQPNPDAHRTACGRTDNIRRPFAMTEYTGDVDCRRCLAIIAKAEQENPA